MGGLGFGTWLCVLMPHVAALTGFLTLYQFFVAVISFVAMLCLIMFTWLLGIQIVQLIHGQTKFEHKKGHLMYDLGFCGNARNMLGSRWYLAWLIPWIPSPLPGDGIAFPRSAKAQ
jgi:palmitoyltransferase